MAISKALIRQAVVSLSEIEGVFIDQAALVEDVVLLAKAFPEELDYMAACASTRQALEFIVAGKVNASDLKYDFADWKSYHYQHRVGQGIKATCRIMYRQVAGGIEVKGFGHRRIPGDFYERMSSLRKTQGEGRREPS